MPNQENSTELVDFLSGFGEEKLLPLCKILKINLADINNARKYYEAEQQNQPENQTDLMGLGEGADSLINRQLLASSIWAGLQWRASKIFRKSPSYQEILKMTAEEMGINIEGDIEELEGRISQKAFDQFISKLSREQKADLEKELRKVLPNTNLESFGPGSGGGEAGGIISSLLNKEIIGFGTYLAAATSLSAMSSAIGIGLPFIMGLSLIGVLRVAIGPLGWILGGIFSAWSLWQPNYKVIIPAILYIAALHNEKNVPSNLCLSE